MNVLIGCPPLAGLPPATSAAATDRCCKYRTNGIVLPVVSSEKVILPGSGLKLWGSVHWSGLNSKYTHES